MLAVDPPCDAEESALTSAADAARVLIGLFVACSARAGLGSAIAPLKRRAPGGCKPRRIALAAAAAGPYGGGDVEEDAPMTPTALAQPRRRVVYYRPESRIDIAARTIVAVRGARPGQRAREAWVGLSVTRLVLIGTLISAPDEARGPATQLLTARGEARWVREGTLRAALGNTPDTSKVRAQAHDRHRKRQCGAQPRLLQARLTGIAAIIGPPASRILRRD